MPTVIVGSARDIVEHCGVPRFLFPDFPLGNPSGPPWQPDMQRNIVKRALGLLETATAPRTTLAADLPWKDGPGWRARYGQVDAAERDHLIAVGEARRQRQLEAAKLKRQS